MDEPVTDIVFVSSKSNCPEGYRIIEKCPCGHEAQMWEKVLGGQSGERYLCFSKEEKDDDMVIEDMYIPGRSAQYLYKGYKIIKLTVEGDEPMYHKQLAIKRVPRSHASKVIADIIICRSRDNVSKMYKKLEQVDVGGRNTPSPTPKRRATTTSSTATSSITRNQRGGSLKIEDVSRHMAGVTLNDSETSKRRGSSPGMHRTMSPLASHTRRSHSPSPQPVSPTRVEADIPQNHPPTSSSITQEATDVPSTVADTSSVPSAPATNLPQSTPNYPSQPNYNPNPSTYYPPNYNTSSPVPPTTQYMPHTQPYSTPSPSPQTASYPPTRPLNATYPPQPPTQVTVPPTQPYPSPSAPLPSVSTTYPPQPSSQGPAAPYGYGSSNSGGGLGFTALSGGVQPPPPTAGYPSYPPQGPPGGYGGYGAVAGSSFAAAPIAPRSGPAPYNPYQSQQGQSSYPPSRPPAASSNYGFRF